MNYRIVMMYVEIGCFAVCVSGWILVCSTMPTEIWTWSEMSTIVLTAANYYSNLWKDCVSDSTGISDCKEIPSLFGLDWDIHMCRALIITSIILGFFSSVLVLVGMKCTKIGGSDVVNAKVTFAGGISYLISGLCSMIAFSYFGNKLRAEFQDPGFRGQRFEIGVGVYIGWGGATLLIVGGLIFSIFAGKEGCSSSSKEKMRSAYRTPGTYVTAPGNPTVKNYMSSPRTEAGQSRKSRSSSISGVTASSVSFSTSSKTPATTDYV